PAVLGQSCCSPTCRRGRRGLMQPDVGTSRLGRVLLDGELHPYDDPRPRSAAQSPILPVDFVPPPPRTARRGPCRSLKATRTRPRTPLDSLTLSTDAAPTRQWRF